MTQAQLREGQYADVMPDMSDEEFEALKRSIDVDGLKHPIEVTDDGTILDGHHRYKACRELGLDPETTVVEDATVEQAIRANFTRRNLSDGAKKAVVLDYLEEHYDGDRTQGQIAEALGVSQPTVSRAMAEYSPNKFTREEARQQASDYLDDNPDASPRQVAESIEADVSHPTVRKWMDEDGDSESTETDEDSTGTVEDTLNNPATDSDTSDDTDDAEGGSQPPQDERDASDVETDTGSEGDTAGSDAGSDGETEPESQSGELQQLLEENERLQERIDELEEKLEGKNDRLMDAAEIRESARSALSSVTAAKNGLDGEDPSIDLAASELESAQGKLESVV